MKELLLLNFVIPVVMLLVSVFLKRGNHPYPGPARHQTKWKVDFSGYNTPGSRKSQERWEYAQRIAPEWFFYYGKWGTLISVVWSLYGLRPGSEDAAMIISIAWGFVYMIRAFYAVEKKLKEEFGE